MKKWIWTIGLSLLLAVNANADVDFDACFVEGYASLLECATFTADDGAKLRVVRKRAIKLGEGNSPLLVLAGGPGQAGSELVRFIDPMFFEVNQYRDIYFVDRRGTGASSAWQCEMDLTATRIEVIEAMVADCRDLNIWDPEQLNSKRSVDDLDQLRASLGIAKWHLWGGSWGTRFALLYASWYPDSIDRMVIDAVAPLDRPVLLSAQAAQGALEALHDRCQAQVACARAFPDFLSQVQELTAPLDGQKSFRIRDPLTNEFSDETFANWMLAQTVRGALYSPMMSYRLPYIIDAAYNGDWRPLAALGDEANRMGESMYLGLTYSVLCAEEIPRISQAQIDADSAGSFIGSSWIDFWQRGCDRWNVSAKPYPEIAALDHPTLVISGALDPITPPQYGEQAMQMLSNAQHIVFANGAHINSQNSCMPETMASFFGGATLPLDATCAEQYPFPIFMTSAQGPDLQQVTQ